MPGTDTRTFKQIKLDVAQQRGVTVKQLASPNRTRHLALARHQVMYEAYATKRFTTPQIGMWMNRDHSSVVYAVWKHAERNDLPFLTRTRKWCRTR